MSRTRISGHWQATSPQGLASYHVPLRGIETGVV